MKAYVGATDRYQHVRFDGDDPHNRTRSFASQDDPVSSMVHATIYDAKTFSDSLLVHSLGGEGYLNFEGNEFGHPEVSRSL